MSTISITNVSDKMTFANHVDTQQKEQSDQSHTTKYFQKQLSKKHNLDQNNMKLSVQNFGTFTIKRNMLRRHKIALIWITDVSVL